MLYTHSEKFLPANESEQLLPPVSRWISLTGIVLLASIGSAIALSSWIQYNVIVKAAATIRPTGDTRIVQPEMQGTVKSILVKENQIVKQGDAIAILDDEQLQIKKSELQNNIQQSTWQSAQMYAQIRSLDAQIGAERRLAQENITSAQADLARNQQEYQQKQVTTQSEYQAALADLEKTQADLLKDKAELEFAKRDSERYRGLSEQGAVSKGQYDQKKLAVDEAKSLLESGKKVAEIARTHIESAKAALNPSNATVTIAAGRIPQENDKGLSIMATLIKEKDALIQQQLQLQTQSTQYQKELQQLLKQLQTSMIRATSDGIILKLNLRNSGQVVNSGESIAEIIPQNTPLTIKAMIPTTEIKKVAINQKVLLRVDGCAYPDYGTLKGTVKAISPDAITPQVNHSTTPTSTIAGASYFEATIQPEALSFGNNNHTCRIQAGMGAQAEIISKSETAIQFLLRKARLIADL